MTYSGEEIKALQKRLKAAEAAIKELSDKDLLIAKLVGASICPIEINIAARTMKGEEVEPFVEFGDKIIQAAKEKLNSARTVEEVFEVITKFDYELGSYVKAERVATATEAMDIAHTLIKKYSTVALPMKAVREDDVWLVDIDVGALSVKIAKVKVDAKTGDVLSYEIPEKRTTRKQKGIDRET